MCYLYFDVRGQNGCFQYYGNVVRNQMKDFGEGARRSQTQPVVSILRVDLSDVKLLQPCSKFLEDRCALRVLEGARALWPESSDVSYNLAVVHLQAGNVETARNLAEAAVRRKTRADLHHLLGDIYERQNLYDKAVAAYQAAIRLDPKQEDYYFALCYEFFAYQTFIPTFNRPQVAEGRYSCGGSNKAVSVERDSFGKEQLLEPLALFEGRLHPQVGGSWQNPFCKLQDALHVEFFELAGMTVDPDERELLAQLLGVAVVRLDIDRALDKKRFVQTVEQPSREPLGVVEGPGTLRNRSANTSA